MGDHSEKRLRKRELSEGAEEVEDDAEDEMVYDGYL